MLELPKDCCRMWLEGNNMYNLGTLWVLSEAGRKIRLTLGSVPPYTDGWQPSL